jgi:hypothetical protein
MAKRKQPPKLSILPPGSIVTMGGGIDAGVLEVKIGPCDLIAYHVVWWVGPERRTAWVDSFEVKAADESELVEVTLEVPPGQLGVGK